MPSYKERQLQRLLLVESGIAVRRVVQAQILVDKSFASACTFRDGIAGKLKMHATQERAMLLVNLERRRQFGEDAAEGTRLDPRRCAASVSVERLACILSVGANGLPVHGIALPDDNVTTAFDSFNMGTEHGIYLVCPVTRDKCDLSNLLVGVHNVE